MLFFNVLYVLAQIFGKTDRTHVGDLYVAQIFGIVLAKHVAPDGDEMVSFARGSYRDALLLAERLQNAGLQQWVARESTDELRRRLRLSYNAMQHDKRRWVRECATELYTVVLNELDKREAVQVTA